MFKKDVKVRYGKENNSRFPSQDVLCEKNAESWVEDWIKLVLTAAVFFRYTLYQSGETGSGKAWN